MSTSIEALFQRLTQGVYVIGVGSGKACNAFTAAWVMQVSFDPLLLALSINPQHSCCRLLRENRAFSVNVLGKHQQELAAHFGQPAAADKLASADWTRGRTGVPLLDQAIAWFECRVMAEQPAGDHVLVLGRVIDGKLLDAAAEPLTYRETGAMDGAAALFPDAFGEV
jgi:flavin reductase (DIM6/NTAB) family NADH-FMN oxidoreductase RutF